MKTIKLMPDYGCFPLWALGTTTGNPNIDPATLPISPELQTALHEWATSFDSILNQKDPGQSDFATKDDEMAFEAEGKRLWRDLQSELGSKYKVVYFSQAERRVIE